VVCEGPPGVSQPTRAQAFCRRKNTIKASPAKPTMPSVSGSGTTITLSIQVELAGIDDE